MSILLTKKDEEPITEIKTGDKFVVRKDVVMRLHKQVARLGQAGFKPGPTAYVKGKTYKSEYDGSITNEQGNVHHGWRDVGEINRFFRKVRK